MTNDLPKNWTETELGNILISRKGKKPNVLLEDQAFNSTPYILIEQLEGKSNKFYTTDKNVVKVFKDEVLMVWDGSIGKFGSGIEGALGSTLVAMKPIDKIPTNFLKYIIFHKQNFIKQTSTGVGLQHINKNFFKECKINLPPLLEQERIVAKLDILFSQQEAMKKALKNIPQLFEKFRQQVLTLAVIGKLTEKFSADENLEDWKVGSIEDFLIKKGIFDGPFGSNLKTEDYIETGNVRVIRLENIDSLKFLDEKRVYISDKKYSTLSRHEVFEGDIIFSSFISERIRACILPSSREKMIAKADCFCLRSNNELLNKEFFIYLLNSPLVYNQLLLEVRGATRPRINTGILKRFKIKVPTLSEQEEIVIRVKSLFAKIDSIEKRYEILKEKIDSLPQAILHKAFKGELVPQLPTDGDAKDLLKEILKLKSEVKKK